MHIFRTVVIALSIAIAMGSLTAPGTHAQAPVASPPLKFEVTSIKVNKSGEGSPQVRSTPNGVLTVTNNTLRNIVRNAYGLQNFQIVSAPSWFDVDRFDIVGKASAPFARGAEMAMLRALLADRFRLVVHNETRDMPIYALVKARSDGRLGPQLRRSPGDCMAIIAAARPGGSGPPAGFCGTRAGPGSAVTSGVPIADFARNLGLTGRFVVDKTELTGPFDLELKWTPDQIPADAGAPNSPLIDGTSLFTAIQEQLGLKLDSQRGPVEVLVIDSAEPPTPD